MENQKRRGGYGWGKGGGGQGGRVNEQGGEISKGYLLLRGTNGGTPT